MSNDKTQTMIADTFGQLPAYFVPNVGQKEDKQIFYEMKGAKHGAFFTSEGVILTFFETSSQTVRDLPIRELGIPDHQELAKEVRGFRLDLRFLDANPGVKPEGRQQGTGKVNYLKGNDPTKWITNLSTYEKIVYRDLWPGIDLVFRGKNGQLKYEFVVQPGISPEVIRLTYRGADSLSLDEDGNLRIRTPFGVLTDESPISYQERDGQKVSVTSSFVLEQDENGENVYAFKIGDEYDPRYALIIDPGLIYSTYLGGSGLDLGVDIAVDSSGNAYVVGLTQSANFPTTAGVFDTTLSGLQDVFVTKLNPAGSGLIYSTYLGGSAVDSGLSIALDSMGNAYVTGITTSSDFPTTAGAFDTTFNGGVEDTFVTKLNSTGSGLIYSTYLGGSGVDRGNGIAVDSSGNAYVTGLTTSSNFPTTAGAFDTTLGGAADAFVTKLNPAGTGLSDLVYSTYLGGSGGDTAFGIAIDASGNVYVTGSTDSTDFPTTAGAFDTSLNGSSDAFVTKLNPAGSGLSDLVYSTYLGGSGGDAGFAIAIDTSGNAYVTGRTTSTDFPTTAGAFDTTFNGGAFDAFVTKINPAGSGPSDLVYSTYLGGLADDQGHGIAVDGMGNAYVTGKTASTNFPTTSDAFDTSFNGVFDAFVTRLNPAGTGLSDLAYSTYLGGGGDENGPLLTVGIAIDALGNAYVTGATASTDFPTTAGAFDTTFNGGPFDAFVAKINTVSEPEITCPDDITVQNDPGVCGAIVNYPPPTVNDECPAGFTVVCDPPSGSFFPEGTTPVTCTVTDPCGGFAECTFTVTVNDTEPPVIVCPDDITVSNDPGTSGAFVNFPEPTVSDNCPGVTAVCTPASGSFFPPGTTRVTCTATDASGNTSTCSFNVRVIVDPCRFFSCRRR